MSTSSLNIESLTTERQIFRTTVQPRGGRISVPRVIAELNEWKFGATICLRVERRGQAAWEGVYALYSGHEIAPQKDDHLRKVLKPGASVRVTVASTFAGLNSASWMPAYLSSRSDNGAADGNSN